ncbi:uncharacterized protein [Chironomus tepperi]|uniref:uncharacterized protein n=1 Tax=Chironomus tepperi TaxID=113505 RepID=UPI00391EF9DF
MLISRDVQSENFLESDVVNDDFFYSIVERKLNITRDQFKVRLVLLVPAVAKTDSYMSNVYRVKIKVEILDTKERLNVDVVLKVLLAIYEIFGKFGIFERECLLYEDVILSLEKIWLEKAGEVIQFAPKCLKIESNPYEIIVLDDLKVNGYEMMDRKIGLTAGQTKLALTKLAKFHAASAVRYQKDGILQDCLERMKSITPEMKRPEREKLGITLMQLYQALIDYLRKYGDCDEYADKILCWNKDKILHNWIRVVEPMKCGMVVLTHGDYWLNNLMFKSNDSNEPEDVQMLDFQSSYWGTPSLDLHYFLISSVHDDIKVEYYDEFIEHYHDEFEGSLMKLGYDQYIPTLDDLYEDLLDKSEMVAMSMLYVLISAKYESNQEYDLDYLTLDVEKDPEFFERTFGNETYKKAVTAWLPLFNERGYLDRML